MSGDVYRPLDRTPEEWRLLAGAKKRQEHESFERSDTDGFMTQWAADRMASLYLLCASIAEDGGLAPFTTLAQTPDPGETVQLRHVVPGAREVRTRHGYVWAIWQANGSTRWFRQSEAATALKRRQSDERRGYLLVTVRQEAVVVMTGDSVMSVRPRAIPARGTAPVSVQDDYYVEWEDRA
jgi:hypothetical protein